MSCTESDPSGSVASGIAKCKCGYTIIKITSYDIMEVQHHDVTSGVTASVARKKVLVKCRQNGSIPQYFSKL